MDPLIYLRYKTAPEVYRPKRPPNHTDIEFSALQSLRARADIAIKPAVKRGSLYSLEGDLYRILLTKGEGRGEYLESVDCREIAFSESSLIY